MKTDSRIEKIYQNLRHAFLDLQTETHVFFNGVVEESKGKAWKQGDLTKNLTYIEMSIDDYFIKCLLDAPNFEFLLISQEHEIQEPGIIEEMFETMTNIQIEFEESDLTNYSLKTQFIGRKVQNILVKVNKLTLLLIEYLE